MKKFAAFILIFLLSVTVAYPAQQTGTKIAETYAYDYTVMEFDQLTTATDNTQKIDLLSADRKTIFKNVLWQVKIAGITTNVVYRLQGSLNGEDWASLDSSDITKTSNGTYTVDYQGNGQIRYIRLYWVSETGGTAATLDVDAFVYKKEGSW